VRCTPTATSFSTGEPACDCAIRNCEYFEIPIPLEPFSFGVRNPIRIAAEGTVHVSEAPRLGADLDWDALDNHTIAEV
jgi:L-alanine-DL-glutamate epimerase-like enolase superfamily enzyme